MSTDEPTSDDAAETTRREGEPQNAELLRLLVGGSIETGEQLRRLIAKAAPTSGDTDPESGSQPLETRARQVLIGLLFVAYDRAARSLSATARVAEGALDLGRSTLEPIRRSRLLAPVRWPFDLGAAMGLSLLRRLENIGAREESRSRETARRVAGRPVDEILRNLRDNPEMQQLVLQQARELLAQLPQSQQLESVVRTQGDLYVQHLSKEPARVQELVSGQSIGLVNEVMNVLRYQTFQLDQQLERLTRFALRRKPREELPLPPPEVRYRADHPNDSKAF